ncbi:malto-oligosyltrehalose trehalohydrolase [Pseudoroseicyclus aestuarii]|uniref:Malto-oligosyltrehalose trehalohydrolase n=1 Tax=Pseudoroseicyclus aestuarii TaxID=1795041 RepID=A0A318SQ22_9RHOB|nr:malto-oligosyltrehalose trehalohydrolase [Pseudoroseicyclus aestuarii]PYE83783.1 maltooligosyl trehalose hydrolase [Pseudoroseicyclus aestuarii]
MVNETTGGSPAARRIGSRWGAHPGDDGAWDFGLWAPGQDSVALDLDGARHEMTKGDDGFWRASVTAKAGQSYKFAIGGQSYPDPASRRQDGDVHAPSVLVDAAPRAGRDSWAGRPWAETVVYELHLGTFTPEGTFKAAAARMADLAETGITAVEIMPIAQWRGNRGWGYDGVLNYAPHPAYGTPDELHDLVEAAHAAGISVFLDVVYNHFGPDGAYIHAIAPEFFDEGRMTPWGAAIAFDKPAVRDFFMDSALYWLVEFNIDGLRFDAIHQIQDTVQPTFIVELAQRVREAGLPRPIHLITEDERNIVGYFENGVIDGTWNDDWHHSVHVSLTGESNDYYSDYAHDPVGDLVTCMAEGQVWQGKPRPGTDHLRGEPSGHLPWTCFVNANQNHDQVGNRLMGERLITLAGEDRAKTVHALLLCLPFIPMLFMGEEVGEEAPFMFFCDHDGELARMTREGRMKEFGFPPGSEDKMPDPNAAETMEACRPFKGDPARQDRWRAMTRQLLALRREKVVPLIASGRAGAAQVTRTSDRSVHAIWPFEAGQIECWLNIGTTPDQAPDVSGADHVVHDIASDPFAFAVKYS